MAIARMFRGKGWTRDQYDELITRMELNGRSAPGVLFHWAAAEDGNIVAVDVYESRAAADELAQTSVGPLAQELGLTMPEITEYEVHG